MEKELKISQSLQKLVNQANKLNKEIYVVGGNVRNQLLGIKSGDIDLAGNLSTQEMLDLAKSIGFGARVVNEKLGTVLVNDAQETYEYTTYRAENYKSGGHHIPEKVEFVDNVEVDALRRDFTVNAFYYDINKKQVLDFFNGLTDLENKTIKCIKSPEHVFVSDGLRILRFIRFGLELGFKFDKASLKGAKRFNYQLKDISKERILKELRQIIVADTKYGISLNQAKTAIKMFNYLDLYKYVFNSQFGNFKLKTSGKIYNAYLNSGLQNRFYAFMVLVLFTWFKGKHTSNSNVAYTVNTLLGTNGLRESNENINKIINLYEFFNEFYFAKNISPKLVVKYYEFNEVAKNYFKQINAKKVTTIEQKIEEFKQNNVPFNIGDLDVKNTELIQSGVKPVNVSKVKVLMFNECLNQTLKNQKVELINYALIVNDSLNKK